MDHKKQENLGLLANLIKFANADQQYREAEHQFLLAVAEQMGISQEEFEQLFNENIDYQLPANEFERIIQFQRLILLMQVDHEISADELHRIRDFGLLLGLHPEAINQVLIHMENFENGIIPPEQLIRIFQVHHN